ncbi:MAG: plastocyanin/azurin family copper-binding protein [Chthoniobacterales bacterium]
MKNLLPNSHAGHLLIGAAFFVAFAIAPRLAYAQAAGSNPAAIEHHGMPAAPPLDLSDLSEIDEAASETSPNGTTDVSVLNFAFTPATVTVAQGQTVRWTFEDNTDHTVTDSTALGLFDSGNQSSGNVFQFVFKSAGVYPYHCEIHSGMQGKVQVPIQVAPGTGTTTTGFTITWSPAPADAGFLFDVQIKRPGARSFVNWKMGRTKRMTAFTPGAGTGNYSFRARLRKVSNGAHSLYSPFRTITVQ